MTTEYLLDKELEHVYAALMPANRLVCEICAHTGLRVGDVVALKTEQLSRQFWVKERKTGKRRRVNLTDDLLKRVKAQAGRLWAFPGARNPGKHRTRQAVWADVKRAARAFRLPQNVAPHSLRKVYAVHVLENSKGDVSRVQRALNHDDMATTLVYVMALQLYQAKYGGDKPKASARRARG